MRFDAETAISVLRHMSFPLAAGLVPYLVHVGFNTLDREFLDGACPRMTGLRSPLRAGRQFLVAGALVRCIRRPAWYIKKLWPLL